MKPLTHEWVEKAEADLATASRELAVTERPNYDAACFHAQQAAEKYLKAALQERDTPFPKTHDLLALLGMLPPSQARWEELGPRLEGMAQYAVDFRYPGDRAEREDAAAAVETAREVRRRARALLGLRE